MKPTEELRELWEAEWSGENLSESAVAEKFIEWVEKFETKLREQIAQEIEGMIVVQDENYGKMLRRPDVLQVIKGEVK